MDIDIEDLTDFLVKFYMIQKDIDKYTNMKSKDIEWQVKELVKNLRLKPEDFEFFKKLNFDDTLEFSEIIKKSQRPIKTYLLAHLQDKKNEAIKSLIRSEDSEEIKVKLKKKHIGAMLDFIEERKHLIMTDGEYKQAMELLRLHSQ